MYNLIDLSHLNWTTSHNGGVSYGCYYKASEIINGKKYYYKCSNFYSGQRCFGDESIYEVICSRFLGKLGFDCLKYTLVHAKVKLNGVVYITYVCKSENFFVGYDSRTNLEDYCDLNYNLTQGQVISKLGIARAVDYMIVADFLVLQRDRHGKNIELLEKNSKYTLSPLFDNGLGLLAPYPSSLQTDLDKIKQFNVLFDYPVNNYIGSRSLYQNLNILDKPIKVNKLRKEDKRAIFYNLNGLLPKVYIDKIWELLTYRYKFLLMRHIIVEV